MYGEGLGDRLCDLNVGLEIWSWMWERKGNWIFLAMVEKRNRGILI